MILAILTWALIALAFFNALLTFGCWLDLRRPGRKFASHEHEASEAAAMALSGYSTVLTIVILILIH